MAYGMQEALVMVAELRRLCALPAMPGAFERIDRIARTLQQDATVPAIAAQALDVRFRAEDVYARPHLMPEPILRQMLDQRLHRLEATVRASLSDAPVIPVERRSNGRAGRRATDRQSSAI